MINPVKVQIVEDEIIVASDLENRLKVLGYQVTSISTTGEDALLRVRVDQPDIVLMDINLKGRIDGIQTSHRMRAEYEVPVIFLSAYSDETILQRAKISEAYGYLIKPCGDRELRVAIEIGVFKSQADRKMKGMQRWLASTMRSLGDGVISTDLDGKVSYMNPLAQSLTGWTWPEAKGRELHEVFNAINETSRLPIESPFKRALAEGACVSFKNKTLLIQKGGNEIPVDDSCAPILDDKNLAEGVVLVFRDATPIRLAEAESIRVKEIAYRNEKMVSLGRIAGGVAHDFNNLMAIVTGYTEMVLSEMPESIAARRLRTVIDAGIKASGVAQNLLSFSRQSPLQPIDCDLNEAILGMSRVLEAVAQGRVTIIYELSPSDIPVRADKTKLFQVMLNLAVNACDAMKDGGVLTISTEQTTIISGVPGYGLMSPGPTGVMKFTDNGSGIDDDTKKHLFEPFFTRKAPGKGTGLGLATVAGIIGQSGGHVSVISEVDKGSTFTVFLPLRIPDTQAEVI